MTQEEEISLLKQQLVIEQRLNSRTLEVIELVQIRLAALDDEYRRLVGLTTAQEETTLSLGKQLDAVFEENSRLRTENITLRAMLVSKPIESAPLSEDEYQLLDEMDPE